MEGRSRATALHTLRCVSVRTFWNLQDKVPRLRVHHSALATQNLDRWTLLPCCHCVVAGGQLIRTKPCLRNFRIFLSFLHNSFSNLLLFPITRVLAIQNVSVTRLRYCAFRCRIRSNFWKSGTMVYYATVGAWSTSRIDPALSRLLYSGIEWLFLYVYDGCAW